jgi:3-oxoadipate enol-lactonase
MSAVRRVYERFIMHWRTALVGLAASLLLPSAAMGQGAPTTAFAHVNQTSLRYQLAGSGSRTIVLLHELGMSLESWGDIVSELATSYRVLRYDLRGFGLSEKLRGVVTIDDHVDDLRALLDSLGITEPVTLVGGALGGAIALRVAAAQPQRVTAVMALSPAGDVAAAARPGYLARAARLERLGMRADVDATQDDTYPPMLRTGHEDRFARFLALQYANDPVSMAATLRMIAITEWAATWPKIQCSAWFVAVAGYKARPIESVRSMASSVARGHFEVLNTGPFVPVQAPELLLPLLRKFLALTAG